MLQVIISPAKQMRVDTDAFTPRGIPPFPEKTERIVHALRSVEREQGSAGLQELWRVNDKLCAENIERLRRFVHVEDAGRLGDAAVVRAVGPAITSYVGIQYRSMAPDVLASDALAWLEGHLWVLSALYGCVRPFDAVQPYRLEMAAKLAVDGAADLYDYWGADIACAVCRAQGSQTALDCDRNPVVKSPADHDRRAVVGNLADHDCGTVVVNLASVEYAKAVLPHLPAGIRAVSVVFGEELRAGKPVQRATASKIARGSMVRWMAEHAVEDLDDLKGFDVGYAFAPELSSDGPHARLVFMRS